MLIKVESTQDMLNANDEEYLVMVCGRGKEEKPAPRGMICAEVAPGGVLFTHIEQAFAASLLADPWPAGNHATREPQWTVATAGPADNRQGVTAQPKEGPVTQNRASTWASRAMQRNEH